MPKSTKTKAPTPTFVDVFAGCGGLSLGLMEAGWKGLFAIEKDVHAFATLKANLLDGDDGTRFEWPKWLPKTARDINAVLREHRDELRALKGQIDLLVGGPPCQGFSTGGTEDPEDPRNMLFKRYIKLVGLLQPRLVLLENVRGISAEFVGNDEQAAREPHSEKIRRALERRGYKTFPTLLALLSLGYRKPDRDFSCWALVVAALLGVVVLEVHSSTLRT